ncbi:alpha/beta fold hydrolase [uncultured Nocardioides sp.]|uniref:alpha/beta fold hydrolase n=1 Tax=uncultured Nocardioides sp. TaxID=198441 RepID=UPI0026305B5D|nr:alpha/beta fold hydrolase [uncultured Nocardioides sp.]
MTRATGGTALAAFLCPDGFAPPGLRAIAREARILPEVGRAAAHGLADRRHRRGTPYAAPRPARVGQPVLLVPGFMAGDRSLSWMARELRAQGYRTHRSGIHANVGCTQTVLDAIERRAEAIAIRRGSPVLLVGHSLGGMLARGLAGRRPDLVAGLVTLGSPVQAPGAHHRLLTVGVGTLTRLAAAGLPGVMAGDCVRGDCARLAFEATAAPLAPHVPWTAVYSRRDGVVDWRACTHPRARGVEVTTSHCGMAVDPTVVGTVLTALAAACTPVPVAVPA